MIKKILLFTNITDYSEATYAIHTYFAPMDKIRETYGVKNGKIVLIKRERISKVIEERITIEQLPKGK